MTAAETTWREQTEVRLAYVPRPPEHFQDLDIPKSVLLDLIYRRLLVEGMSSFSSLSAALKLPVAVVEPLFRELRQQQLVEVKGMLGNDYQFTLTNGGRAVAAERTRLCAYCGPAPVSLRQYQAASLAQIAKVTVTRQSLQAALGDLVISGDLLDQLGPAIIGQTSLFLYGPTGNGKTSVAERLLRVYDDAIAIPYAIEVDGQIIALFDPVVHRALDVEPYEIDPRWVVCRRPCIMVGGELTTGMLELRLDESSNIYAAPLQMKANNGIFLIDDFGRQMISPRELLNRWIVPLDRHVDYLTLRHGVKFQIPFTMMVVFSTNLDPSDLADEAFMRRIQNKVFVHPVSENAFDEIFRRTVAARNLHGDPDSSAYLRSICRRYADGALRACYPKDICNIIAAICEYDQRPLRITRAEIDRATGIYFTQSSSGLPAASPARL